MPKTTTRRRRPRPRLTNSTGTRECNECQQPPRTDHKPWCRKSD